MDDYYKACMEKLQADPDILSASTELLSKSLSDLPKIQICKFTEQAITILSVTYQSTDCPTPEFVAKFKEMRKSVDFTLDFMEQTLRAQVDFPSHPSAETCWF